MVEQDGCQYSTAQRKAEAMNKDHDHDHDDDHHSPSDHHANRPKLRLTSHDLTQGEIYVPVAAAQGRIFSRLEDQSLFGAVTAPPFSGRCHHVPIATHIDRKGTKDFTQWCLDLRYHGELIGPNGKIIEPCEDGIDVNYGIEVELACGGEREYEPDRDFVVFSISPPSEGNWVVHAFAGTPSGGLIPFRQHKRSAQIGMPIPPRHGAIRDLHFMAFAVEIQLTPTSEAYPKLPTDLKMVPRDPHFTLHRY